MWVFIHYLIRLYSQLDIFLNKLVEKRTIKKKEMFCCCCAWLCCCYYDCVGQCRRLVPVDVNSRWQRDATHSKASTHVRTLMPKSKPIEDPGAKQTNKKKQSKLLLCYYYEMGTAYYSSKLEKLCFITNVAE